MGCECAILNKYWFSRSAPETKCCQKSGILKLIMGDVCVCKIKDIHPRVYEICSGNEMREDGRRDGHKNVEALDGL